MTGIVGDGKGVSLTPSTDAGTQGTEVNSGAMLAAAPAKSIGASASLKEIGMKVMRGGGSVLRGLGSLFQGAAVKVNQVIAVVSFVVLAAALIPGAVGGGGVAILGALVGAVAGAVTGKGAGDGALKGAGIGLKIGAGLVLFAADLPFIIGRVAVSCVVGGIGFGLAALGGTSKEDIVKQMQTLINDSFHVETGAIKGIKD